VILPETPRAGARLAAERIRARVEEHFKKPKRGTAVTVSGGIATYPEDATTAEDMLRRADEALYRSKAAGKNRITLLGRERRHHERVVSVQEVVVRTTRTQCRGPHRERSERAAAQPAWPHPAR
jgi:predicted signal transduction protein with EAL and GGDEF domain